jgi:hypothetical protein
MPIVARTEQFRGWRQEKVAKIVHCGEALAEKKLDKSLVSTEY